MSLSRVEYEDWERQMLLDCGLNKHFVDTVSAQSAYEEAALCLFVNKDVSSNLSNAITFAIQLMRKEGSFRTDKILVKIRAILEEK